LFSDHVVNDQLVNDHVFNDHMFNDRALIIPVALHLKNTYNYA